ncbi:hypothetical protein ACQZ6A_20330 [Agrobacterium vitis]
MQLTETVNLKDDHDRARMFALYQERGPQTESNLLTAGISKDSQQRNAAAVAYRIRLFDAA